MVTAASFPLSSDGCRPQKNEYIGFLLFLVLGNPYIGIGSTITLSDMVGNDFEIEVEHEDVVNAYNVWLLSFIIKCTS